MSGQDRRRWLNDLDAKIGNALNYYLGPAAAPVNALANVGAMLSPGADMMDMVSQGNALMRSDGPGSAGMNALGLGAATLGMAIPGTARGVGEAVEGAAKGIRAYHGSPHDFDAFDLNKIGTGEGAQAYGHGLYFAENEGVARSYRDSLANANRHSPMTFDYFGPDGQMIPWNQMSREQVRAANIIADAGGPNLDMIDRVIEQGYRENAQARIRQEVRDFIASGIEARRPGHMYEVNINADPADFLDWDAPLAGQSPAVREKIRAIAPSAGGMTQGPEYLRQINPNNATPFTSAADRAGAVASERLREAGIPGIKYLDQGSRGAGDGSRNYVVFDPATIEILRKYGLLGMIGGGGAMAYGAGGEQDGL